MGAIEGFPSVDMDPSSLCLLASPAPAPSKDYPPKNRHPALFRNDVVSSY